MKAEDYIAEWCDKTYGGGKELGDWTTKEVMKFANDFAKNKSVDKSCVVCGDETKNKFNIALSPIPVCEKCARLIFIQQAQWFIKTK